MGIEEAMVVRNPVYWSLVAWTRIDRVEGHPLERELRSDIIKQSSQQQDPTADFECCEQRPIPHRVGWKTL